MMDLDNQVNKVKQVAISSQAPQSSFEDYTSHQKASAYQAPTYEAPQEEPAPMIKYTRSMIFGKKKPAASSMDQDEGSRDPRLGPRITRDMVFGRQPAMHLQN